jgi:hypothetical protein
MNNSINENPSGKPRIVSKRKWGSTVLNYMYDKRALCAPFHCCCLDVVTPRMHFGPKCIQMHRNAFGVHPKPKCISLRPKCISVQPSA